jgi:hypothetical protein
MSVPEAIRISAVLRKSFFLLKPIFPLAVAATMVMILASLSLMSLGKLGLPLILLVLIAYLRCLLILSQGEDLTFSEALWPFSNLERTLQSIFLVFLYFGGALFLSVFFVIPGLWFLVAAYPAFGFFVQQNSSPNALNSIFQALKLSKGQWWRLCGLAGTCLTLQFLGSLLFGIGFLIVTPVIAIALLVITLPGRETKPTFGNHPYLPPVPTSQISVNPR